MAMLNKHRSSVDDSAVMRVGIPAIRSSTITRIVTSPAVNTGCTGSSWSPLGSEAGSPKVYPGREAFDASTTDAGNLFSAIAAGDLQAVQNAMQSGLDPNTIDDFQEPALQYVIRRQDRRIFSLFLTLGVSVNASDLFGRTALHVAVGGKDALFVDYLLRAGADSGTQDQFGNTPLHLAAKSGAVKTMMLLMEADPSIIDLTNLEGATSLHVAVKQRKLRSAALLLKAGAKGKQSLWQHAPSEDFLKKALHLADNDHELLGTHMEDLSRELDDRIQNGTSRAQRFDELEFRMKHTIEKVNSLQLQLDQSVLICKLTAATSMLCIAGCVCIATIKS